MRDCFFRETQKCSVNGLPERTHLEDKGGFIRQKRGQKFVCVTLCRKGYKTYRLESNVGLSLVLLLARQHVYLGDLCHTIYILPALGSSSIKWK